MSKSCRVDDSRSLGKEKLGRLLLRFAAPCVLSMLVSALYNICDQIFIGHSSLGYLGNAATNADWSFGASVLLLPPAGAAPYAAA